jgi:hypothetical protein
MAAHTAATAPKTTMRQLMKRPRRPHRFQLQRAYRGRPADGSSWSIFSALLASAATARQSTRRYFNREPGWPPAVADITAILAACAKFGKRGLWHSG